MVWNIVGMQTVCKMFNFSNLPLKISLHTQTAWPKAFIQGRHKLHKRLGRAHIWVKQNFSNNQFEIHIKVLNTSILSNCADEPLKLQKKKKARYEYKAASLKVVCICAKHTISSSWAINIQGPHHVAKKSTIRGTFLSPFTSSWTSCADTFFCPPQKKK